MVEKSIIDIRDLGGIQITVIDMETVRLLFSGVNLQILLHNHKKNNLQTKIRKRAK